MPYITEHPEINKDYFTDNNASGGRGGRPFDFIKLDNGAVLEKIKAWKQGWRIRAIQVFMSDGSDHLVGKRNGKSSEFQFRKGERIQKLNVQASVPSSGGYRRLGAIWFQTDKGRNWGVFSEDLQESGRYWPDVGSGICCGVFGASGSDVDRFGFAMLHPIDKALIVDVKYPNLDMELVANTPAAVASQTFENGSGKEQSVTLEESKQVTITREWSLTTELSMTINVEVSAGIPTVGEATTGISWTVGITSTYSVSSSETETKTWTWPLVCPPHRQIHGKATIYSDDIDTEYEAKMELHLSNGKKYQYPVKGVYTGMNVRLGKVTVTDLGPFPAQKYSA